MAVLTESQVSQLLLTTKTNRFEALYHLAITSGARESELLGLKLIDLDWIKRSLKIERQLVRPDRHGVQFSTPKTLYGRHTIILGSTKLKVLRKHYERQQVERKSAGEDWEEHGLIFITLRGTPIHQRNLLRRFKDLLKQAGLPQVRFHDLRHSYAYIIKSWCSGDHRFSPTGSYQDFNHNGCIRPSTPEHAG